MKSRVSKGDRELLRLEGDKNPLWADEKGADSEGWEMRRRKSERQGARGGFYIHKEGDFRFGLC
jgi:hypothetical protein